MKSITVLELKSWQDNTKDFQLIDIREDHEVDAANMNGEHIKMSDILDNLDRISKAKEVVIHCRSGARSGATVQELMRQGYDNVYNLTGGIMAWANEIDNSLDVQ